MAGEGKDLTRESEELGVLLADIATKATVKSAYYLGKLEGVRLGLHHPQQAEEWLKKQQRRTRSAARLLKSLVKAVGKVIEGKEEKNDA